MSPFSNAHRAFLCLFLMSPANICRSMYQRIVIMRTPEAYHIFDEGKMHKVKSYDADPVLRRMNSLQLKKFVDAGCSIRAHKLNNGDYALRSFVPGKGGGPYIWFNRLLGNKISLLWYCCSGGYDGCCSYRGCSGSICHRCSGTPVAAGGVAAGAGTAVVVGGVTAEVAAGVVAGGLAATAGMAEGAALTTAAVVSSAGGIASAIAAVESASLGAGVFFAAIPFLP